MLFALVLIRFLLRLYFILKRHPNYIMGLSAGIYVLMNNFLPESWQVSQYQLDSIVGIIAAIIFGNGAINAAERIRRSPRWREDPPWRDERQTDRYDYDDRRYPPPPPPQDYRG